MAGKDDSLKRLGGGRWETRDGRFAIEPQSGTWVIVDNTQTDDLGLPLVRGPFPSLTAAKAAIEDARESGPAASPLAEQLQQAKSRPKPEAKPEKKAEPPPPKEPKWLADLAAGEKRRAKSLISTLEGMAVENPEGLVRDDLVDDDPAVARVAIGRRLARLADELDLKPADVKRLATLFGSGRDDDLGVRWRLVDGDGREVGRVEPVD